MSAENLVCDMEKGNIILVRDSQSSNGRWKCLSICSFLLLVGATAVFTLLHFRHGGSLISQVSHQSTEPRNTWQSDSAGVPASKELVWSDKVAHTMMQNGMALVNNKLVVPSNGLYFIYSQVVFKGDKCPEESIPLRHTVLRYSVDYPENVPLLMAIKSFCEGSQPAKHEAGVWFESIYQGAVFQLTKGDEISSEIDSAQYLDLDSNGQVYFGVIALELEIPQ
uniref:Tumor necrosis factor n=1 Tax=Pelusios castaneus TaxID=367368 RepID=A0A8C8RF61_9SAUR